MSYLRFLRNVFRRTVLGMGIGGVRAMARDEDALLAELGLPAPPRSLREITEHFAHDARWQLDATVTSAGVRGLDPDDVVIFLVTHRPTQAHCSIVCQQVKAQAYVVDGVSIVPGGTHPSVPAPLWTYRRHRVVSWVGRDGQTHYAVEEAITTGDGNSQGWRTAEEWDTRIRPDAVGGVIDCLLWIQQKGQL